MENVVAKLIPVTLMGENYFYWSKAAKAVLKSLGLWDHITKTQTTDSDENQAAFAETDADQTANAETIARQVAENSKWVQEDNLALAILQSSLDSNILKSFIAPETTKELWETLQNVYGNVTNLCRIFELKKRMFTLQQNGKSFNVIHGEFSALWTELEELCPPTVNLKAFKDRLEEDKVFSILLTLDGSYNDLIYHILRQDRLPKYDEVCMMLKREEAGRNLFAGPSEMAHFRRGPGPYSPSHSNRRERSRDSDRARERDGDRRGLMCDHYKRSDHVRDKCWVLHPHLKPTMYRDAPHNRGQAMTATNTMSFTSDEIQGFKQLLLAMKDKESGY
ncbi:PREDICTED: uncharacterized protein LOC104825269 [Tarenaya hassleriana]|uniref:uncharacterized protein LOC104825269 n=1 Tax=Tarenaya hassleriana TaxID=28532 RepID=UPI00053C1A81|nr:PREDICTED: uncharacterized protein LOC104825269 [Tarenaya hassleriana]